MSRKQVITGKWLVSKKFLSILPLILFLLLVSSVGYVVIGGPVSEGTTVEVSATAAAKETEVAGTAMAEANQTATGVAEQTRAEASATAAARETEVAGAATAEANQSATGLAEQATAEASATAAAEETEVAGTATAEANQTATGVAEQATAEASAAVAAEETEVAGTATAEANQSATAAAQIAMAETNATATAKALTPPATPTPKSDARVVAPTGVVLLRSGPGTDYDRLATLSNGTALDVLRWVHNKDDWIKVVVNPDSNERVEGYVNLASGYIEINVELADFPPIYEFGPALFEPKRFESRGIGDFITFKWQEDYAVLEEDQYYSLIIVRDDLKDEDACYHWQTKETEMIVRPEDYENCTPGAYHWGVGIATMLFNEDGTPMVDQEGKQVWRDDSEKDERFPIGLGIPHPDKPQDGGGGSGNGSTPGGSDTIPGG